VKKVLLGSQVVVPPTKCGIVYSEPVMLNVVVPSCS
jgi:hypothetical protein